VENLGWGLSKIAMPSVKSQFKLLSIGLTGASDGTQGWFTARQMAGAPRAFEMSPFVRMRFQIKWLTRTHASLIAPVPVQNRLSSIGQLQNVDLIYEKVLKRLRIASFFPG
jgi:hypothetical protein